MAGPGIDIQITGDTKGVEKMLFTLETALNPLAVSKFLGVEVETYLQKKAGARFSTEGDSITGAWAPLSEATIAYREADNYGGEHPINIRTGELERLIVDDPGRKIITNFGASLVIPGPQASGVLGKKLAGAQKGGVSESGNPWPPRPVIGMDETDLVFVLTALAFHIKRAGKTVI